MKEGYKVEFDMYLISAQVVATQNLSTAVGWGIKNPDIKQPT